MQMEGSLLFPWASNPNSSSLQGWRRRDLWFFLSFFDGNRNNQVLSLLCHCLCLCLCLLLEPHCIVRVTSLRHRWVAGLFLQLKVKSGRFSVYTSAALDPNLSHIHAHTHVRKENNALADGMCHWNPCWYGPHTLNHIMALHGFKSTWRRSIQCGHTEKSIPFIVWCWFYFLCFNCRSTIDEAEAQKLNSCRIVLQTQGKSLRNSENPRRLECLLFPSCHKYDAVV